MKCTILILLMLTCGLANAEAHYIGELVTKVLRDGRKLELAQPYSYEDADGRQWGVPKGTVVDGASIPTIFWSFVGGPFSGKYRDASVIHDYYCDTKHRDWRSVHKVFHAAMRTSEVPIIKAALMYFAVYRFGPRWEVVKWQPSCPPGVMCNVIPGVGLTFKEQTFNNVESDLKEFQNLSGEKVPTIEEIEDLADRQISRLGSAHVKEPKNSIKFYRHFRNFPEQFDYLLSDLELRLVRVQRSKK